MMISNVYQQTIQEVQAILEVDNDIVCNHTAKLYPLYTPIKQDFLSLILFSKAKGKHLVGNTEYIIGDKQLHIVFPGQIHSFEHDHKVCFYRILIGKEMLQKLEGFMKLPINVCRKFPVTELSETDYIKLAQEFFDVQQEYENPSPVSDEIMYSKMKIITQYICDEITKRIDYVNTLDSHPILFDFITLLNNNCKKNRCKIYYAQKLAINPNYLNILCKKHFKQTASDVIQKKVIEKIKEKIKKTDDLLKEISIDFDFQNYGHFSAYFKKHTGLTPKQYRKKFC